jgi:hypothetical protein
MYYYDKGKLSFLGKLVGDSDVTPWTCHHSCFNCAELLSVIHLSRAAMCLISIPYVTEFLLTIVGTLLLQEEDLKQFRQWGSKTPGHPENFETPGVEVTTGLFSSLWV